jgi:5-aminolevulinate synthase
VAGLRAALVETWTALGIPFASQRPVETPVEDPAPALVLAKAGG